MSEQLSGVSERMKELGLGALAVANRHSVYWNRKNEKWAELSIVQAAHAAEILFKAKIAENNYKLIFRNINKLKDTNLETLIKEGKTLYWNEIPEKLGDLLPDKEKFEKFAYVRNNLQHFGVYESSKYPSDVALDFIFSVIDPFINKCWGLYAIDYNDDCQPYESFPGLLVHKKIEFLVSPKLREYRENWKNGRIDIYGPLFPKDLGDYMDTH